MGRPQPGRGVGRARGALGAHAARPQASPGVSQRREHRDHPARHRRGGAGDDLSPSGGGGARLRGRDAAHPEPCALQEPAVSRSRRRGPGDRHPGHRAPGRPRQADAAHLGGVPGRLGGDRGAPAAQRVRQRMGDLPGAARRWDARGTDPAAGARRRGAGAGRRAGAGVLRQGVRHRLPGSAADA